jgi:putative Mg2+ transporter-C (MgtC) family protein
VSLFLIEATNGDQLRAYFWVLLALLLGAIVGLEREYRGHEAGLRTTALVCAGATMFTQVSVIFGDSRLAAGVVQGVGFLGAGLIFQRRQNVHGITTAATIWVMAAVGVVAGERLWLTAVLATFTVLAVLELAPVSDWVLRHGKVHTRSKAVDVHEFGRRRRRDIDA